MRVLASVLVAAAVLVAGQVDRHFSKTEEKLAYQMVAYHCKGDVTACETQFNNTCFAQLVPPKDPKMRTAYEIEELQALLQCIGELGYTNIDANKVKTIIGHIKREAETGSSEEEGESGSHEHSGEHSGEEGQKDHLAEFIAMTGITEDQLLPISNCASAIVGYLDEFVTCINQ